MSRPIKSQRADGFGHWPKGKARSTLSAAARAAVIRRLRKANETESVRGMARAMDISDRSLRRILSGEDQPTERIQNLLSRLP